MRKIFYYISVYLLCYQFNIDIYSQGTVELRSFNSPLLGETKYYRIYLPEGYYQSTESYPVVYFFRNHESEWFTLSSLNQVADGLIDAGLIGKMILVGPNTGSNNGNYWGCINMLRPDLAPSSGIGTGKFEDYIITDLVTHIDTTFRTIADKQHRGIDGFSLGGFISTAISLRNPQVFSSIGSYDGTLMYEDLNHPGIPGTASDDNIWMNYPEVDALFDNPRNVPYMLEHSVCNILESADTSLINQMKLNRYHISHGYNDGAANYWRNKNFISKLREKGIRNSWGNPLIHENGIHNYKMADVHATASLIKHWQTFNGTKISAPTLIDYSITELSGKTRELVVFNYGPGILTVTDVQINSAEYNVLNLPPLPITLQPEVDSLVFSIKYLPSAYHSVTDTAYIYSDDPVTPLAKIILRGKGGSFKAEPGILYAASNTGLYYINVDSFIVSYIGTYGNDINNITELCIDPYKKELFGFGWYGYGYYDIDLLDTKGGNGFIYQNIQHVISNIKSANIGYDSLFYAGSSSGEIYSFDHRYPYWLPPFNQIASTGLSLTAIAFNPVNGQLWAAVGTNQIYTIDIASGNTVLIGNTGLNKQVDDIAFDNFGVLYGLVSSGLLKDTLVTINTSTGSATKLGALNSTALNSIAISTEAPVEIIAANNILPQQYHIFQNYPNPFNPSTTISWQSPVGSHQTIKVFDVLGNKVATLVNEYKPAGRYEVEFNAEKLASGIYFYKLQAGDFVSTKKMILLK
jgi:S-formylglutathione hydrolase FrmB